MKLIIKGGRVIDPAESRDEIADILIENGTISSIGRDITVSCDAQIDARGMIVFPGIVDMHVHLREPGREDKETVASGTKAALKGGVTSVLAMPNTAPAIDSVDNLELLQGIIRASSFANVFVCAAITRQRQGKELTSIRDLKQCGAVAISDDGNSVDSEEVMLKALREAKAAGIILIDHCQDNLLSAGGSVNLGLTSTRMGLKGISRESEYLRVKRDISLAQKADAAIHIAHVSCAESIEIIAKAKQKGVRVSAEAAPHHFSLDEEAVWGYDTNMKMNPPLRGKDDLSAIRQGLRDGVIDVIASDHAPHTDNEKEIEFERAEFGVIGLETELAASITELVEKNILDWPELIKKLTINPAGLLGIKKGRLGKGMDADLVVVSPGKDRIIEKKDFVSKSKNSPFLGKRLKGCVEFTICRGETAFQAR
ncbi:MAG: dihydroorotase [Candidatus Omnitrophica bacterium]|nr:dihydroorotase [Candidatus Omnitrophota bacterium]MDD5513598.1 dihydroorotase [Candidatus Omnitrophota bacterium]